MAKSAMQELISAITGNGHIIINQTLIDTYLGKEKQQIIDACKEFGNLNGVDENDFEQYYNEKYNKNE
jgi:hypothetical protein